MTQPLSLPQRWVDELTRQRIASIQPLIHLSYLRGGVVLPAGCTTEDVRADLEQEAWLVRDQRRRENWFRLGGTRYEVVVKSRPAENGGHTMAVAYEVSLLDAVPPTVRMRPQVRFVSVFDEFGCDLGAVLKQLEEAAAARFRLQRARQPPGLRRHGSLRALVSKEYGQLGTLLTLLAERAARQRDVEVAGTVVAGDRPRIELDSLADGLNRRRITIQVENDDYNTQVSRVDGRVLTVDPIRDWDVPAGTRVQVTAASRFAMRQNAEALQRFQRDQIDGDWEDLATLLCAPKQLTMPNPVPQPLRYFCDSDPDTEPLNQAQRAAVAGALASPHAYLIQGPPGTGKTTVISELIQQLIARGERVLMLAPSHVAVDEVLSRVGPKPGVRALRITWNTDKVDAELHPYLFDRVGRDLARRALREGAGRRARWSQRAADLDEELARLGDLRDALREEQRVATAYRAAMVELIALREAVDALAAEADGELAEAAAELDSAHEAESAALSRAARAADAAADLERTVRPGLATLRETVADALDLVRAVETAQAQAADAERMVADWSATIDGRAARLDQWRRYAAQTEPVVNSGLAQAAQRLAAHRSHMARQQNIRWLDRIGLGTVYSDRRELVRLEQDWQRWADRRAQLDRSAAQAAKDERDLAEFTGHREAWQRLLRDRAAKFRAAADAWSAGAERVAAGLAEVVGGAPGRRNLAEGSLADWTKLCDGLVTGLDRFLSAPHKGPRLPDRPATSQLKALLDRYQSVVQREVSRAANARAATEQRVRAEALVAQRRAQAETVRAETRADIEAATGAAEQWRQALTAATVSLSALVGRHDRAMSLEEVTKQLDVVSAERVRISRYEKLRERWERLTADQPADELVEDVRKSFVRATNLVCATTKGIVSRGSQPVRDTDYDTLIVDEASRVTESEFLIGAVRARRWVLVGDEHQLPPHVDGDDEQHLHALTAIHRMERGAAATLDAAIDDLAVLWKEDEELHEFRRREVNELAGKLLTSGEWTEGYRATFQDAHKHFSDDDGGDAALLAAMRRHLVHSLFQQAVSRCTDQLRTPLLVQRRMVPALARVVRQPVYGGRYLDPPPEELERIGLLPLTTPTFPASVSFIDTSRYAEKAENQQVGRGFANQLEREAVLWALRAYDRELLDAGVRKASVSILAFYKAQSTALAAQIGRMKLRVLEPGVIDVIDAIQGQQADIVLLSFTRAISGRPSSRFGRWLQDVRRLNVACTRARRALVLVGHADTLRRLNGVDEAKAFYEHLFTLFAEDPDYQLKGRFK
ncbi:DEAD/DEAH box helicase [Micromonospora sp. CPCC 206061]|uniref:DEAD/DEAH box helicase n=1 Tax=Micromonospora sp. CPCC 206061 TaxID=3122410 RepID=UPI002FF117D7